MRKLILCLCVFPILIAAKGGEKTSKAARKKTFVTSCNTEGDKQFTDPPTRKIFHAYCECAGERVVNKFTDADWDEIDKLTQGGNDSLAGVKMTPIIQPCLDELQRKIVALKATKKK